MRDFGGDGGSDGGSGNLFGAGGRTGLIVPFAGALNAKTDPKDCNPQAKFPPSAWRPDLLALLVIPDFCESDWRSSINLDACLPATDAEVIKEVDDLIDLIPDRPKLEDEISAQDAGIDAYFAHLLMLRLPAHQNTLIVLYMALKVGQLVAVHFKTVHERGRPQQVNPALVPIIQTPPHASYPSGHSTESHLVAFALAEVVPQAKAALTALAERLAHNREIAGVHFASDTAAGKLLAEKAFEILMGCDAFKSALKAACDEHHLLRPK